MNKNTTLWILAVLITLSSAVYQRITGPTHPVRGDVELQENKINYKLIRSYALPGDAPVQIKVEDKQVEGFFWYKRTPSNDSWSRMPLKRQEDYLIAYIPEQPAAGKVQYQVILEKDNQQYKLNEEPVVIRFRGDVPAWALIPHVIFMFSAMLLSTRTGLAALAKQKTSNLTLLTILFLITGGLLLGPIVQKYAFGAYWTGWPFGTDLTDNKTAFAFIFWGIAFFASRKNQYHRKWVVIASMVLLMVYLIPHSMMGSEIDFTKEIPVADS